MQTRDNTHAERLFACRSSQRIELPMAKEFEGYAREFVLLARLADSVELLNQPIQLLCLE